MSLRRKSAGRGARPGRRSGKYRPELIWLEDRSVPSTTVTPTTTTGTTGSTTDPPAVVSTTGTTTATTSGTTTTTDPAPTDPPVALPPVWYAVGTDVNNPPRVKVYDSNQAVVHDFLAYDPLFRGGVRTAVGDVNGDGTPDIVTAPGFGLKPYVKVFDGVSGQLLLGFNAYDQAFRGGVYVAIGDVTGDGRLDIVTGAGETGGPHVRVFDGAALFSTVPVAVATATTATLTGDAATTLTPTPAAVKLEFFAYDVAFTGGVRLAVEDVTGDGKADIVTGAGETGGPHVKVFNGATGQEVYSFFAYDVAFRGGVYVAAGELTGDAKADIVTGMGNNGNAQVKVYDGPSGRQLRSFLAEGSLGPSASVRVSAVDLNNDDKPEVFYSVLNRVAVLNGNTFIRMYGFTPFDPGYLGGVYLG